MCSLSFHFITILNSASFVAELQNVAVAFAMPVHTQQLEIPRTDFHDIIYERFVCNSARVSLRIWSVTLHLCVL